MNSSRNIASRVLRALLAAGAFAPDSKSALAQPGTTLPSANVSGSIGAAVATALADAADSASLARTHYRTAREALGRGDTSKALEALLSATRTFPSQPAYATALWETALSSRNADMARNALTLANDNGIPLRLDARAHTLFPATGPHDALFAVQERLTAAIDSGKVFRTLSDARLFPEGVTFDARNGTLYVTSLHHRTVTAIDRDGSERVLMLNAPSDVGGLYGIAIDTARNALWAASAQSPSTKLWNVGDSALAALLEIDSRTGAIRSRYALKGTRLPPSPGDVAIAHNGDVFVGDGQAGVVWWLKRGELSARMLRHKLYRSPQGMVPSDDGRYLWIADYSHGLLRTELATGETIRVATAHGFNTVGIDGLVRHGSKFIAVQNALAPAQVLQFELDSAGTRMVNASVIDRNTIAVSPTGGVMVGDDYAYISNTLWDKVGVDGSLPHDAVRAPVLLRVRITSDSKTFRSIRVPETPRNLERK